MIIAIDAREKLEDNFEFTNELDKACNIFLAGSYSYSLSAIEKESTDCCRRTFEMMWFYKKHALLKLYASFSSALPLCYSAPEITE